MDEVAFDGYQTYIHASYVKWLEAAGARVIPLNEQDGEIVN